MKSRISNLGKLSIGTRVAVVLPVAIPAVYYTVRKQLDNKVKSDVDVTRAKRDVNMTSTSEQTGYSHTIGNLVHQR